MINHIRKLGVVATFFTLLLITQEAQAHAHLKNAMPADRSEVAAAPKELTLKFTEDLEASFSGVELKDATGNVIPTGKVLLDPADKGSLIVSLDKTLASGKYQVDWHVLSVDGHKTKGEYTFTIK